MSGKNLFERPWLRKTLGCVVFGGLAYFAYNHFNPTSPGQNLPLPNNQIADINQNKFLTQAAAELRWCQLEKDRIHYNVDLLLKKGDTFQGLLTCSFIPKHANHDLFFDFRGQEINALFVNDQPINNPEWNKLFIHIPKELLKPNQLNKINIRYTTKYAGDGCGLHSYTDADGKQYLYSQGESYFCNRFFPCMDQPDLKATLRFTVVSPKEWVVISNENPTQSGNYSLPALSQLLKDYQPAQFLNEQYDNLQAADYKQWVFGTTKLLPTYLFCIIAGQYWSVTCPETHDGVTQTIYCRESLKDHMNNMKDFIFQVTFESMKFYEQFFGVKYQFSKYDSIFVAEYNWGAMENPGCVTFNDIYVFREQKPATSYTQFANTIAHEMAHHWFGDYVTMKWWNDLWLNESYADFISHFCLEKITKKINTIQLSSIPVMFNLRKGWGYREDQMVTTHPIAGEVKNTEEAETIFDGITYSKGAATMKQLLCIMGEKEFGDACGNYFRRFAWKNARLDDLIEALQEKFKNPKLTLQQFKQLWIEQAGMNEIVPEWDATRRDAAAELKIVQRPALDEFPTLRWHKIKIGFFKEDGSVDAVDTLVENQEETVVTYNGHPGYKAVLLNFEDQSFVKVLLDETSLRFFEQHLHLVQDVLTRTLIYRAIFDTVRDGKLNAEEYIEILLKCLQREASDDILNSQLQFMHMAITSMTPKNFREILSKRVFGFLLQEIEKSKGGAANRLILLRTNLFSFALHPDCVGQLVAWWYGNDEKLKGVELTNDSRWQIVRIVHESSKFDGEPDLRKKLLDEQKNQDKSDLATKNELRCKATLATGFEREQLWASFCDPANKESAKQQAQSMMGFNSTSKVEELEPFHDKFFDVIIQIFETKTTDFAKTFYDCLFPDTDDLARLRQRLTQTLDAAPAHSVTLRKNLAKSIDSIKRKLKQYECFSNNAKLAQGHHHHH